MELLEIGRILLRRWWLIAIPLVLTAAVSLPSLLNRGGAGNTYTTVIRYSAAPSYDAIPRAEGDYQDIWLSSELTVNAFTDWVRGSRFVSDVAAESTARGVEVNPAALGIAADNERSVGQIFVSYPDAPALETIAASLIHVLRTRNAEYFAQLGGEPAAVTILDQTPITLASPPLPDRLGIVIRFGLGLLAGIGLALLAHYFDRSLRRRQEVESLGLPVLAAIPRD